jgi:hypothetical protein
MGPGHKARDDTFCVRQEPAPAQAGVAITQEAFIAALKMGRLERGQAGASAADPTIRPVLGSHVKPEAPIQTFA